jgi:hypothetical protein
MADAVSDRLRTISGVGGPTSRADVEFERTNVGGVGLLIRSGAVVRGGRGIGVEGEGGTVNLALAGESASPTLKCESSSLLHLEVGSSCETKSVGVAISRDGICV